MTLAIIVVTTTAASNNIDTRLKPSTQVQIMLTIKQRNAANKLKNKDLVVIIRLSFIFYYADIISHKSNKWNTFAKKSLKIFRFIANFPGFSQT